jgi:hypothetical protein
MDGLLAPLMSTHTPLILLTIISFPQNTNKVYAKKVGEVVKFGLPRVSVHVMKLCGDSHEGTEAWMDEIFTPFMLMFG